ncbi:hypothetical protein F5Y16DRAFT_223940 [Xylariaceae sp. FL0255]|nr:hypothetical protein F5Y16DRAFT_223940 [Xylariaceae sp. FL0255]
MAATTLPQEIILIICGELGSRHEFTTLYKCSQVSRRVASIAVEQLYSNVYAVYDTFIKEKLQGVQIWRSIVLSSKGVTQFPYCAYIRSLELGSLTYVLDDIKYDQKLRNVFFKGAMQEFQVKNADSATSRRIVPLFDPKRTTVKCADSITKFIKELADSRGAAVALSHLESPEIPREILHSWVERLSTLTALQLQDGWVLNGVEVAAAIAQCCPSFAELVCYKWFEHGTTADVVAEFFLALRPNSLRKFEILSRNCLDSVSLASFEFHAESLRVLSLRNLSTPAIKSLGVLSRCTALETLLIERDPQDRSEAYDLNEAELSSVISWITNCQGLREFSLKYVRDALPIVRAVLEDPSIQLEQLSIQNYFSVTEDVTKATWKALGQQRELKSLTIAAQDGLPDGLILSQNPELTKSICQLSKLTSLNLMQAYASSAEIRQFAKALPLLEDICFGGEVVDDSLLQHLSKLPHLNSLSIFAITAFTYATIRDFAYSLDTEYSSGIRLDLLNQWHSAKLTDDELSFLEAYFEKFNGRFSITYSDDPDDLHEDDFSDSD